MTKSDALNTWSQLIARHGIATVIAAVLIGWLVFRVDGKVASAAEVQPELQKHMQDTAEEQRAIRQLLAQICVNTAKSEDQVQGCFR